MAAKASSASGCQPAHRVPRGRTVASADGIVPVNGGAVTLEIHNTFAIRYRVL
jgi:hypothetical protein